MKKKIKIERANIKVCGHNGYNRINLLGKNNFLGKTENQAANIIGINIINEYCRFCEENDINTKEYGVVLRIEFEKYTPKLSE